MIFFPKSKLKQKEKEEEKEKRTEVETGVLKKNRKINIEFDRCQRRMINGITVTIEIEMSESKGKEEEKKVAEERSRKVTNK